MPRNQIDQDIRSRIEDFAAELADLIREATRQAVEEALSQADPALSGSRKSGSRKGSSKKSVSKKKRSAKKAAKRPAKKAGKRQAKGTAGRTRGMNKASSATGRPGRPPLQSEVETSRLIEKITKFLGSHPDSRLEEIGAAIGTSTKDLKRPIFVLLEEGSLATTGQRRGTRYRVR